jgi:hypothetical protein
VDALGGVVCDELGRGVARVELDLVDSGDDLEIMLEGMALKIGWCRAWLWF